MTTRKSSKPGDLAAPPTDLELMLYVDGELDASRRREVNAHVLRDASCRAKIAGIEIVGAAIRERALASGAADGIAEAVMAKIERSANAESRPASSERGENGAARRPLTIEDLPEDEGRPVRPANQPIAKAGSRPPSVERKPANDNARAIFVLAGLAAAAAAAMMIWGRMEADPPRSALNASPAMNAGQDSAHAGPAIAAPAPPPASPEPTPDADSDEKPGVEVAAVDFGARMGTIFYVPTGTTPSGPTTTVVWLSDDNGGK